MEFLGPYGWLIAILGGAALLGLFIAFGMRRTAQLTPRDMERRDAATQANYAAEERERTPEPEQKPGGPSR